MSRAPDRTFPLRGGGTVLIRTAREDDAGALLAHGRALVATSPHTVTMPDELPPNEAREREWVREHLADPGKLVLVAEVEGRLVGALSFRSGSRRRLAHHGHFGIGVDEPWRGRGVGRALIVSLLDWARQHPLLEKVCLGVFATNVGARRLYESLGFVEECRRRAEFKMAPGEYVDDIQMSMWVKPPPPQS